MTKYKFSVELFVDSPSVKDATDTVFYLLKDSENIGKIRFWKILGVHEDFTLTGT